MLIKIPVPTGARNVLETDGLAQPVRASCFAAFPSAILAETEGIMRRLLRLLGRILVGLLALGLVALLVGWFWIRGSTLPQYTGRIALKGLSAPVLIEREPSGVAHIKAQSQADMFYALGVAHAQDRLWQMEFQRRVGAGRLSEVLGEATLEQDKFLRTWGFYPAAESAYRSLSPEGKSVIDSYVAGVNAYLATQPPLPVEFRLLSFKPEPWKPADAMVWAKMMSYDLSGNWRGELENYAFRAQGMTPERIAELKPPYPEDAPTVLLSEDLRTAPSPKEKQPAQALLALARSLPQSFTLPSEDRARASNNWVISGAKTTTGKPLLANDPHLGLGAPSVWYLAHLEAPGYNAIGATFPGLPAVVIGRNDYIAWGVTTTGPDVQDLYILEEAPGGYRYRGTVEPYRIRREVIRVKGKDSVVINVRESRYGPVINDIVKVAGTKPLALRWTSLDPEDRTLEAFVGIDKAKNWQDFTQALSLYRAPSQNFVYADVEGNIGYMAPAKFPIRKPGHSGLAPVPGDGNWDWQGYLPQSEWPQVLNPKEGFIVTANNKVTPKNYPHVLSLDWEEPFRAMRIRQMILSKDKLSPEDMRVMQQDVTTLLYPEFRPVIELMNPLSSRAKEWQQRLLAWDGVAREDSLEASVFEAWYSELSRLPAREVGKDFWERPRYLKAAMQKGDPNCDQPGTELKETCLDYAALSLEKVLDRFGGRVPAWGTVHQAVFKHQVLTYSPLKRFSDRRVGFGGDRYTVNRGSYDPANLTMTVGSSYREVIDFSNLENSLFVQPMGQSGAIFSNHYSDLLGKWRSGAYLPMKTRNYPVESKLVLEPQR